MQTTKADYGMLMIISSPSGAGKTTIIRQILRNDKSLVLSTSVTTRKPRSGEVSGADYHFIDDAEFDKMRRNDALLEHATVFGCNYGTPRNRVETALSQGQDVLFDIDWQGAQQLRVHKQWHCISIFILPPSKEELAARLLRRAKDSLEEQQKRLAGSLEELLHYDEYDYVLINDDLDTCIEQALAILTAERSKLSRQPDLSRKVAKLRSTGG